MMTYTFYNENFDKVTFIACQRHILAADLDKINLDNDDNFNEDDSNTIIHVKLLAWRSKFKKRKALKKKTSKELMPAAWHTRRWWTFCMTQDEKKGKKKTIFTK